jgi:hypothetical protein
MERNTMTNITVLVIIFSGVFLLSGCQPTPPSPKPLASPGVSSVPSSQPSLVPSSQPHSDLIMIDTPQAGAVLSSPLTISGKARGQWYFEASFPVKLLDDKGNVVVQIPVQAQGDWMTTEFVPFTAKLEFVAPTSSTGTLVFEKDNPSGLPENDKKVEIPVRFR